jgi:hypothetical protein
LLHQASPPAQQQQQQRAAAAAAAAPAFHAPQPPPPPPQDPTTAADAAFLEDMVSVGVDPSAAPPVVCDCAGLPQRRLAEAPAGKAPLR